MGLTNEHVEPKILAKIKIYVLTRAELLFTLCYEIPCIIWLNLPYYGQNSYFNLETKNYICFSSKLHLFIVWVSVQVNKIYFLKNKNIKKPTVQL